MGYVRQRAGGRLIAVVMAMGLVLAACSDDSDNDAENDTTDTTAVVTAGDPNGVIKVGYEMVQAGAGGGGMKLDPNVVVSDTNDGLMYMIYGRLMRPNPDGSVVPDQAESVTITSPSTIEIVVREGQTFHDGSTFDAAAVKAGLERTKASGNTRGVPASFFELQSIDVTGALTLTLNVSEGKAPSWVDTNLGRWQSSILKADSDPTKPIGAGPMKVVSWTPEKEMVLTKFADYWDADAIQLGGLELFHVAADQPQSAVAALGAGQIDMAQVDVAGMSSMTGKLDTLVVANPDRLMSMALCKREGPLADARVRKALNKAIDREAVSEAVFSGTAEPGTELWPEGHRFFNPDVADELAYDLEGAKQLLADAGYADGFSFDVYSLQALGLPEVAEVTKQQFEAVGVTMNIIPTRAILDDFYVPQVEGAGLIPVMNPGVQKLAGWSGELGRQHLPVRRPGAEPADRGALRRE